MMEETCDKCAYYKYLISNPNFGQCLYPRMLLHGDVSIDVSMAIIGKSVVVPLVHREDSYSCFLSYEG